jgi:hypothetical protein
MSGVGVLLTVGANAALLGGGAAALNWATGGFGKDAAEAAKAAAGEQVAATEAQEGVLAKAAAQARADLQPFAQAGLGGAQGLGTFQAAGVDAVAMQRALAGLDGPEAQRQAVAMLESSPQFAAMLQQGENAILQNASATGGLRGGNTQAALAQFRPALLSSLIEQQYARLGGLAGAGQGAASNLAGLGQASAAGQAASGAALSGSIADVLGARGAYRAGGILGATQAELQGRQQAANMALQAGGAGAGLLGKAATGGVL